MSDDTIETELVHGELVHGEIADGIATLTLDSPANRNALSARLVGELPAHLSVAGIDPSVRAVVLTHTVHTFCAGADLAESAREGGPLAGTERLGGLLRQIVALPKPVVAVVGGNVRAGCLSVVGEGDVVVDIWSNNEVRPLREALRRLERSAVSVRRSKGVGCT